MCVSHLPASREVREKYQKAQLGDHICFAVIKHRQQGLPKKDKVQPNLKPYWNAQGELTVDGNGLLLYSKRIVVPKVLQRRTLKKIHEGHQGIQRSILRAMTSVWWPGINHEIQNLVKQCPTCTIDFTPRKEPLIPTQLPDYPWQKIGTDLFHLKGVTYILIVDYFSRYHEIQRLTNTTSHNIIQALKTAFARHGVPETVVSDNGPQYASQEFANFAKKYDFAHITSSPLFPQSNGQAEQTVKKLLKEATDPQMALVVYRTTPLPWCSLSPAELLMGRRLRANIPVQTSQLTPDWKFLPEFRQKNNYFKEQQKRDFDRYHSVRDRSPIPDNTPV